MSETSKTRPKAQGSSQPDAKALFPNLGGFRKTPDTKAKQQARAQSRANYAAEKADKERARARADADSGSEDRPRSKPKPRGEMLGDGAASRAAKQVDAGARKRSIDDYLESAETGRASSGRMHPSARTRD